MEKYNAVLSHILLYQRRIPNIVWTTIYLDRSSLIAVQISIFIPRIPDADNDSEQNNDNLKSNDTYVII